MSQLSTFYPENVTSLKGTTGLTDNALLRADGVLGSTAQGSAFIIPDNATASPNNTVNHASIQATGGTTNVSVSIVPKGAGALSLSVPDSAATGGNVRGANSIDLQTNRSAATQVASGPNSVIGGGQNNTNAGDLCFIGGGQGNSHSTSGQYACVIGGGLSNTMSSIAEYSTIAGGRSNTCNSNGNTAAIGGGFNNIVSNFRGTIGGGNGNAVSGDSATVGGGNGNTASASYAYIGGGFQASARSHGMQAHAAGQFSAQGDAQSVRVVLRRVTTNATATELFLDGASLRLTVPANKVISGIINIHGVRSDGAATAHFVRQFQVKNMGGVSSYPFAAQLVGTDFASGTSITFNDPDTNGDALSVSVTGIASQTWRWTAVVDAVETTYGT
jgi:hypothetical protein